MWLYHSKIRIDLDDRRSSKASYQQSQSLNIDEPRGKENPRVVHCHLQCLEERLNKWAVALGCLILSYGEQNNDIETNSPRLIRWAEWMSVYPVELRLEVRPHEEVRRIIGVLEKLTDDDVQELSGREAYPRMF